MKNIKISRTVTGTQLYLAQEHVDCLGGKYVKIVYDFNGRTRGAVVRKTVGREVGRTISDTGEQSRAFPYRVALGEAAEPFGEYFDPVLLPVTKVGANSLMFVLPAEKDLPAPSPTRRRPRKNKPDEHPMEVPPASPAAFVQALRVEDLSVSSDFEPEFRDAGESPRSEIFRLHERMNELLAMPEIYRAVEASLTTNVVPQVLTLEVVAKRKMTRDDI